MQGTSGIKVVGLNIIWLAIIILSCSMVTATYLPDYEEADVAEATIDTIVKSILVVGLMVKLIVLGFTYKWVIKKVRGK